MTNAETRFNNSLRPRKPEGSLGRTAQDVHLDSHTTYIYIYTHTLTDSEIYIYISESVSQTSVLVKPGSMTAEYLPRTCPL